MTRRLTLCIDRLLYLGPDKTTVGVELKPGLNVLCGASESGKSFVVETIDFMLGGASDLRDLPERAGYDRVVMQISLSDERAFTIQRALQGGSYLWRAGRHDQLAPTDEVLRPTHDAEKDDNLSVRILSILGLGRPKLRRDKDMNTVSFTLRNLALLSIVQEDRIIANISPVLTANRVMNTVEKSAFKYALTGVDDSALVAIREAKENQARLVANRNALEAVIDVRQSKLPSSEQLDRLRERLKHLEGRIASIGDDVAGDEQQHSEASTRFRLLDRYVQTSRRRRQEIDSLLQRFVLLDEHYESDLSRLEAIVQSGAVFGALHPGPCPFCGAAPEAQAHENACDADPGKIVMAARSEIERISLLRQGLKETKARLAAENDQLTQRTEQAVSEQRTASQRSQQLALVLRERRRGIGDLDREAQSLRVQLRDADIVTELRTELTRMDEAVAADQEVKAASTALSLPPAETTAFAEELENILKAWDFPEMGRVAWEETRTDVLIGNRRRGDQGKGLRAITCSAFLLALMKRSVEKSRPHLGLTVLDSPLLAYWKPEGRADDLTGTKVDECFYRWMQSLPKTAQVIVIENRPLPDWVNNVAHVIHFTKNRTEGRFGLF
ncbi:ATP-binding protein [Bradyrhizobium diazoefficiens]|uniref:Rad50/SbcC-type AAA domain-containing protein n=1 Tax=Bradyrhizobium diazoefficiens TaxID=1355477 RepID=A0A810AF22_9BRAD|nr:hypothetical protein [Bradyrhizobium diazoefficiens]BBZ93063.1 hypothetical protein F07S3_28960 [Bradyrhizobium diazoefficiens]BCA10813.1 hypothetical protein BDHF08_26600 [Bradyrhizobium diazoefficiens]BCE55149.1 hypothetical protein XF5B_26610 [Bradyrhizobium diazoefficiens]BCE63882.1 hypothetical protein XF6B_26810 [Bradyrhizobium diazoefficiens]